MNKMRLYLALWLSGLIAGMTLMARWQRSGDIHAPMESSTPVSVTHGSAPATSKVQANASNLVHLVVTGAQLDAARARHWVLRHRT
jgi:hypothetical protein